jgi:tetratricopeptide (TPR) repeat protein
MAGKIFINYRRDDSIGMAGRLHDRLAQTFGRDKLFMDVDHIPVGADFVAHLNSQVAACDVVLVVIGPNWLKIKDKAGQRRLHQPDDFVAIEIAAALARDIRVIPVLVDGARMPKESELPDSLKALARRQAAEVRHAHFGKDAEALVARMHEALGDEAAGPRRWRVRALAAVAAAVVLLLIGVGGYTSFRRLVEQGVQRAVDEERTKAAAVKSEQAVAEEGNPFASFVTPQEPQRTADTIHARIFSGPAEAEAESKADEAERQRLEQKRPAEAETLTRYFALLRQGKTDYNSDNYDSAIANYNEAIRLDPKVASGFFYRGNGYRMKGDHDRAIADYNEAIRLDPNYALAFNNRGVAYDKKGDLDRAFADYNEAIRLDPKLAVAFCNRGKAKLKVKDSSGDADIAKAWQLDASTCR